MKLLLASASPRRRELLSAVAKFEICTSHFSEAEEGSAEEVALSNARGKAEEVFSRNPECAVLGADTVVALGGEIFGKPKDGEDAFLMLKRLNAKTHSVFTGVCLVSPSGRKEALVESKVVFKNLSDEEIRAYVASGAPLDKAGGYGIQDGVVVERYEGSYTNIMGLPMECVKELIQEEDYD